MTAPRSSPGQRARRLSLETELREQARQLLALEPGAVAQTTGTTNLATALDYLMTLVQNAEQNR